MGFNINITTNGYLMLQLNLLSFINADENKMSSREIDQIVSKEIVKNDKSDKKKYRIDGN